MHKRVACGSRSRPILGAVAVVASLMASSVAAFGSQAVAYQIDPAHTGSQSDGLTPPLVQRWSRDLGNSFSTISYPLIVEGKVFVLVDNGNNYGFRLYALDEATGATVWGPVADDFANYDFGGLAYDGGRVFVLDFDGFLDAFDASSGVLVWETYLGGVYPDHRNLYGFTSPPTAVAGTVYVSGSGFGAEVLAVSEQDGTLKWSTAVNDGAHSSPAVSASGVYVSYSNAASTALSPTTGQLLWQYRVAGGGDGRTPVLFNNRLYVRDTLFGGHIILDASTGAQIAGVDVGVFPDPPAPAFSGSTGYFSGTLHGLKARDTTTLAEIWSFNGDSPINTAPIVDNGYVYVASYNGTLYALNAQTGAAVWTTNLAAHFLQPDEDNAKMLTGFAAADGLLVVSAGNRLIAFQSSPNQIDQSNFFVKQHYLDFLNRQPDQSGWDFWTNQITACGSNMQCNEIRRIDVSASFFLSIEFQNNGYLVERFYKVAFGNATGNSTFGGAHQLNVPIVRFNEFQQGTQSIGQAVVVLAPGWEQLLETNKQAFALEFVQTSRFLSAFPANMTPTQFVDKLNQNAGDVLSAAERTTAINLFLGATNSSSTTARAQALRQIAEDIDLYNAEYNRAFVLAEYFGYLRRNPNDAPESTLDYTGYDFWLTKLNQFNGNYINAEMVKAFLSSIEYRQRFGL